MMKTIFLVDMQSFYASVEKACHPEWNGLPVIVSGDPDKRSGIILAACPLAKKFGIKATQPLWQARQKCPDVIVAKPHMQLYIDLSCVITTILERYSDQVEVFSIDEQFVDITGSLNETQQPYDIAANIQEEIMETTGIYARVGIAPNKILAKMACDVFAKHNKNGIFSLNQGNMKEDMWPLPIKKLFNVGSRMNKHLEAMGIQTIGQLANFPVRNLRKRWGINGEVLWQLANGIDYSPVTPHTHTTQKAIGHHMTLPYDYKTMKELRVVLLELSEEVARRTRFNGYYGQTISLTVKGASFTNPTGFHRQTKLLSTTHDGMDIFHAVLSLFEKYWDQAPVRAIGIALSQLDSTETKQLNLFDFSKNKEKLYNALDHIYLKYGPTAMFRATSLKQAGQLHTRSEKIGGHYK